MPSIKRWRTNPFGLTRAQIKAGIVWTDRALCFGARWGVPGSLGFAILSGPLLVRMSGGLEPYPGLRSLHVLAGLALVLAVLYFASEGAIAAAARLWNRVRRRMPARHARLDPVAAAVKGIHAILLVAVLWTGIERYIGQRWGMTLLPVLSASEWSLAHRLIAPYYLSALLIHWFLKSRIAWRSLLDQLRRP